MTWEVGDRAIRDTDNCPYEQHGDGTDPCANGVVYEVARVGKWWDGRPVIWFSPVERYGVRCGGCFRKVVQDKREACEPEFVTLLKRTKRTVRA